MISNQRFQTFRRYDGKIVKFIEIAICPHELLKDQRAIFEIKAADGFGTIQPIVTAEEDLAEETECVIYQHTDGIYTHYFATSLKDFLSDVTIQKYQKI